MMHEHSRSVNVSRLVLLDKLRENLKKHREEYAEAVQEYHARLKEDLALALKKVKKVSPENVEEALKNFRFNLPFPQNHERDFEEAIEMMEYSVDENISLDMSLFRAFVKNEWAWQKTFTQTKMMYSAAGSSVSF